MSDGLDADALLRAAETATGLSDYGDDGFRPRFARAVDHLNGIGMDAAGERAASGVCQWLLTSRLQLFDDRKRFPIGDEVIERPRSEEHTSELQSLMRISYAVFCLKKKKNTKSQQKKQN